MFALHFPLQPNILIKDRSAIGVLLPIESFSQPSGQELEGACIGSNGFSDVSDAVANVETNSATGKSPAPKPLLPKSNGTTNVRKTRQAKKKDIDIATQVIQE